MKIKSPQLKILADIGQAAQKAGLKAWAVGGFVRDNYLGKETFDIDICVEGNTKPLLDFCVKKYGAKITVFNDFGTARAVLKNGLKLDFVICRREVYDKPAALPSVTPGNLADDLFRRDFTANAWARSILPGNFWQSFDLFEAQNSIDKKLVKILHDKSFIDDPTRAFRALRFAARFNWRLETCTASLLKSAAKEKLPGLLSRERIRQELLKILEEKNPAPVFKLLGKYGLTSFIFPGLKCPPAVSKISGVQARLALFALAQKENGEAFLKSLHLERPLFNFCAQICAFMQNKQALLKPLDKEQQKIIKLHAPKLPPTALCPLVITGGDLQKAGLRGPAISAALNKISRAQYAGKIKTKAQAVKNIL